MSYGTENSDLRVQRTCKAINTAFEELICETESHSISASKIAQRAQINRKTFYRHYDGVENLFDTAVQAICDGFTNTLNQQGDPDTPQDINRKFFAYFTMQEPYVERILCEPSYNVYREKIVETTAVAIRHALGFSTYLAKDDEEIMNSFIVRNMFDMYTHWVTLGKKITPIRLAWLSSQHLYDDKQFVNLVTGDHS